MTGKTFSIIYLLSLSLMMIGVASFNYRVDATFLFSRSGISEKASDDLLAGNMITETEQFAIDDRCLHKLIIAKMEKVPDIIVLGSSRSIMLRARHFGVTRRGDYFNHSLGAAHLKDYAAIIGCYSRKGALPETIIIEVSPWLFDKRSESMAIAEKWESYAEDYYYGMSIISGTLSPVTTRTMPVLYKFKAMEDLISYAYTAANVSFLLSGASRGYRIGTCTCADVFLIMPDGSRYFPFFKRTATYFDEKKTRGYVKSIEGHAHDQSLEEFFLAFIDYLLANGTRIVLFLPPYHPRVYREMVEQRKLKYVYNYEQMIRALAQSKNIPVVGSYDPGVLHLADAFFYDAVHADDAFVGDLFSAYVRAADGERGGEDDRDAYEPLQKEYHWLEAEYPDSMVLPLRAVREDTASGMSYMCSPVAAGNEFPSDRIMATYTVTVAQDGEYMLWGRVKAASAKYNSFLVEVDEGYACLWEVEVGNYWHWDMVNFRGRADPVKFMLSQGMHQLKIKLRESETKLDKLCLTNDMGFKPLGEGEKAENEPPAVLSTRTQ